MPGVIRTLVVLLLLFVCFQRKARNVSFHVKIPILNYRAGIKTEYTCTEFGLCHWLKISVINDLQIKR